jgi:hypothetical protein
MVLDSRSGKKFFARHPQIHQNYVGSGRVKLFQQFRIVTSLATDCDTDLSLKQSAKRIVSESSATRIGTGVCIGNGITQQAKFCLIQLNCGTRGSIFLMISSALLFASVIMISRAGQGRVIP